MDPLPSPRLGKFALAVLSATILVSVMSASMTTVALPDLQEHFRVGDDTLTWVVTAYIITFATGTVVYGRLADIVGTKPMYVFGLTLFTLASLGVALAPSYWLLVAARAAQGFGGTAVPSLSLATIVKTTSDRERGRAMGTTIMAVGVGFGLGPLVGGALTEIGSWRAPFFVTAASAALLLPLALRAVPGVHGDSSQRFDATGAGLLALTVTGAVLALNRLPRNPVDPVGLVGLGCALVAGAAMVVRIVGVPDPFLSPRVVRNVRFMRMAGVGYATQGLHFGTVVLIPLLLYRYHETSIIAVGVHLLPGALAIAVFGMAGGVLSHTVGNRRLIIAGTLTMVVGVGYFHLAGFDGPAWGVSLVYLVIASGYGMVNASVINAATGELDFDLAGLGVGVFNLVFFLGGATTVALSGSILRSREGASSAINPLVGGGATEFSDALIPVLVVACLGLLLGLGTPGRKDAEPAKESVIAPPG